MWQPAALCGNDRKKYGLGETEMLKGISPLLSPELLKALCEMGHGDEIIMADANFPSVTAGRPVIRADGIGAAEF